MRYILIGILCIAALAFCLPRQGMLDEIPFGQIVLDNRDHVLRIGLAKDGRYRLKANLDQIASTACQATLAYEDRYFYQHFGVNPVSLLRAVKSLFGGRRMGASTITMQVARLRYKLATNNIIGKLKQIGLAILLELQYDKQEILEAYFNLAPYGGNIEGIEAASRIYFQKPASRLTLMECQALAIVPQNPAARNPVSGADFERARTAFAAKTGARAGRLYVSNPVNLPFKAPHLSQELLGRGLNAVEIRTCLDPKMQNLLERSLNIFIGQGQQFGIHNACAMLVDWRDMQVLALAGSANYYANAISGQIDGTRAKRSPGSTLKPFIYALALEQGLIHPGTILADSPASYGGYDPENFDKGFCGPIAAAKALKASRNLPAISLANKLANPDLYQFLARANVKFKHGADYYGLALVLGGAEVSMRELASLYAIFPNRGLWQPLRFLTSDPHSPGIRMLSPEAAWLGLKMLERADPDGILKPVYYKTGTSNGLRDAWTAGIIGQYVLVVWVGNFDNSANPYFVGQTAALPIFEHIANILIKSQKLIQPLGSIDSLDLKQVEICAATGDIFRGQCQETDKVWIIPGVSPVKDSGILRPIWIDQTTGLRTGPGPDARQVWWEFWPSDLAKIFEAAGIHKPQPPEWLPGKEPKVNGKNPQILLPKMGVAYQRRLIDSDFQLPLKAAADAEAKMIFWYSDKEYLGAARPGEVIFWNAPAGQHALVAVDDLGESARQECQVMVIE